MSSAGYNLRWSDLHEPSGLAQSNMPDCLKSRRNITMSMIFCILDAYEDDTKRLTVNGDMLQPDELLISEC
jgi:hypothetical protein